MRTGGAGLTKEAVALTHRSIEAMKPESAPYRVPDSRCTGLAVRVASSGVKTFDLAFRIKGGRSVRTSLGKFLDVDLDKARDRANELTRAGRAGVDLLSEEKAAIAEKASRLTVSDLIENYCRKQVRGKLRSGKEIESRLKRALAPKLETPAEEIKRRDLRDLFDEAADAGALREAEKRRQTVGAMFRWAVSQDYLPADPTAGLTVYDPGTPRERVLSNGEILALWSWLEADSLPRAHVDALKVQLAVGARCGEVAGMMADEVDTTKWIWTLPAARSKNGRERVTPLVGVAREIVERRLPNTGPVFASETGRPLTAAHVGQALLVRRERLPISTFTTHDLRRTFATALDSMGISIELIAAIVGHDSAVNRQAKTLVRHYLRTDKLQQKHAALEAWDRRLRLIIAGEAGAAEQGNVTPLVRTA
jgi:integrase